MTLGNFECVMGEASEIEFWIKNEIGNYDNKAKKAKEWCDKASIGDMYNDDFIYIEVIEEVLD